MKIFYATDCQKDFMDESGALYVPGAKDIKSNIAKLCKQSLIEKLPLFASKDWHDEDDIEFKTFPKHCVKYTDGALLIDAVARFDPECVLYKKTYDVWDAPQNIMLLSASNIDEVVIFGVVTEICVGAAVKGFLTIGKKVTLVTDAIMHLDKVKADSLLKEWQEQGVKLVTTKEVVDG